MADEWRVEVDVEGHGGLKGLLDSAHEHQVAREARHRFGDRVIITVDDDDDKLFAYTGTEEQAREAARVLEELARAQDFGVRTEIRRWHPEEESWKPADVPLPQSPDAVEAERERREAEQEEESREWGYDEWEVRIDLRSRADASALAERLKGEGLGVVHRAEHVIVGAPSEEDAELLAERLRGDLPAGAKVRAQGSEAYAWAELHPFSVFGGLGS